MIEADIELGRTKNTIFTYKVIVHPKLMFHLLTTHNYVNGDSGDIFKSL